MRITWCAYTQAVKAKIDRPAGIVDFVGKKDAAEVLDAWAGNIERVLNLVDLSCHQVTTRPSV